MDRLWAPWRIKYIRNIGKVSRLKKEGCIFCKAASLKAKDYVILKTKYSLSMLNIFPYNNGHSMVAPIKHIAALHELKEAQVIDLFKTLLKTKELLDKVLKPKGYNIGININDIAGAGIPEHLHIHIVPRWKGDTNFMTTVADIKVISQSLGELYKQLKYAQSKSD